MAKYRILTDEGDQDNSHYYTPQVRVWFHWENLNNLGEVGEMKFSFFNIYNAFISIKLHSEKSRQKTLLVLWI